MNWFSEKRRLAWLNVCQAGEYLPANLNEKALTFVEDGHRLPRVGVEEKPHHGTALSPRSLGDDSHLRTRLTGRQTQQPNRGISRRIEVPN